MNGKIKDRIVVGPILGAGVVVNPRGLNRFLSGLNSILLGVYLYVHACRGAEQRSTAQKAEAIKTLL